MARSSVFFFALCTVVLPGAVVMAQCPAEGYPGCTLSPTRSDAVMPGCKPSPSLAKAQNPPPNEKPELGVVVERTAGGALIYYGARGVIGNVQETAAGAAHSFPGISNIPYYGEQVGGLCKIGGAVSVVQVPTTLGETPLLGHYVQRIPVVGNTIAGPPPPWLVGAVAVDTYLMPKYAPCGYTESSMFTKTDFNSAPVLRNYVNYVAPEPYTHPPVYPPAPGGAQVDPRAASMEAPAVTPDVVAVPAVKIED